MPLPLLAGVGPANLACTELIKPACYPAAMLVVWLAVNLHGSSAVHGQVAAAGQATAMNGDGVLGLSAKLLRRALLAAPVSRCAAMLSSSALAGDCTAVGSFWQCQALMTVPGTQALAVLVSKSLVLPVWGTC